MFDFDDEQQQLFNIPIALHKKRSYSAPIEQPFCVSIEQPQLIFNPSNFQSEPPETIEFNSDNYQNNVLFLFAKVKKWFEKYYSNNVLKKR